jgi:transcriptional regulator GlxA family with amidase domain
MKSIGFLLYPDFETLDLFGPVQMFGAVKDGFRFHMVAETAGPIRSRHGQVMQVDHTFADGHAYDLILVPGGPGTWVEIDNPALLEWIKAASSKAEVVMSVCTGAALLAKAGVLDGRAATTNKMNFDWVAQFGKDVAWQGRARWVADGKFHTSSGVTAGMDMSLAVVDQLMGHEVAEASANHSEYLRNRDPQDDPFAVHFDVG